MRYGKSEWELIKGKVVQDLIIGTPKKRIARTHDIAVTSVSTIEKEEAEAIEAGQREILEERQQRIDKFLDDETTAMLDICTSTTHALKKALENEAEAIAKGETRIAYEYEARKDGAKVKSRPAMDVDTALRRYERTHTILNMFQTNADD